MRCPFSVANSQRLVEYLAKLRQVVDPAAARDDQYHVQVVPGSAACADSLGMERFDRRKCPRELLELFGKPRISKRLIAYLGSNIRHHVFGRVMAD